jgi:dephospho-CoA kinase
MTRLSRATSPSPVIALAGMAGAGKSTAAEYFRAEGWQHIRFSRITENEIRRRGLRPGEPAERRVREDLRARYGMDVYAQLLWPRIKEASSRGPVVLDGLYSWAEYRLLRRLLGLRLLLIAVVAPRNVRYQRLRHRPVRPLALEQAQKRDIAEIETLEKGGPIAIADFTIPNEGTKRELHVALRRLMDSLRAKMWRVTVNRAASTSRLDSQPKSTSARMRRNRMNVKSPYE